MNYEKKYKKLVDAIKVMRDVNPSDEGLQNWVQDNVPELAESEDERIRKALIRYFTLSDEHAYNEACGVSYRDIVAWLEKQESIDRDRLAKGVLKGVANSIMQWIDANVTEGNMCLSNMECEDIENSVINANWNKVYSYMKKKLEKQGEKGKSALEAIKEEKVDNANKVVPKFKQGCWVVWQDKCYKVNYNGCGYELIDQNGLTTSCEYGTIDENAHLWTIEDAKDGDVLYYKSDNNIEYIVMNKGINMHDNIDSYFRYNSLDGFAVDVPAVLSAKNDNITLATREQRDLLFSKMKEAGYEWDNDKKELKKIKSKFKGGDYIIHQGTGNIYQVISCIDNQYQLKYGDTYTIQKCDDVDRHARLLDVPKDVR